MNAYLNREGPSGVLAYEIGPGWILVQFSSGDSYLYNAMNPGERDVDAMVRRALRGRGLSTYISTIVRDRYAAKLSPNAAARANRASLSTQRR